MQGSADQVVIVSGGAQRIGKGISSYLHAREALVVIADTDIEAGQEWLAGLKKADGTKKKLSFPGTCRYILPANNAMMTG